jgi:predicted Zn-dependent protease
VIFQRILLLAALLGALLAGLGACTPENNPPQTAAASAAGMRSPPLPANVEKQVGAAYQSPELQALVDRVGQRLVTQARIDGSFKFYILDQPEPNAHALGANYIFVTRGLLALLDDEAELAAAMGHEIGHVMLRHAAQRDRERRAAMEAAVKRGGGGGAPPPPATSGSVTVGRSVARDGIAALRRYSRDQEFEADRAGLGYIVKAGYRGDAMMTLIEKLRREARLQDQILGPAFASDGPRNAMSTHPAPDERISALSAMELARTSGESDRARYLALLDGLSVDDRPEEGFVRGSSFLHPVMKFAFQAPSDFILFNDREGVLGVGRDRSILYFSCTDEKVPGRLDDWMRNKLSPTPTDIQSTTIAGVEAAIGAKPRGADTGLAQIRHVIVRNGPGLCFFNVLAEGPDRDQRINTLVNAARSFHFLSDAEAGALAPYRLHVMPRGNATAATMARRMVYPDLKLERLLALNGVDDAADFSRKTEVKVIEP